MGRRSAPLSHLPKLPHCGPTAFMMAMAMGNRLCLLGGGGGLLLGSGSLLRGGLSSGLGCGMISHSLTT
jgi:hypothetical protein